MQKNHRYPKSSWCHPNQWCGISGKLDSSSILIPVSIAQGRVMESHDICPSQVGIFCQIPLHVLSHLQMMRGVNKKHIKNKKKNFFYFSADINFSISYLLVGPFDYRRQLTICASWLGCSLWSLGHVLFMLNVISS